MFFFNKRNKQIPQAVLRCDNTNLAPFASCTLYNSKQALHHEKCKHVTVFVCFSSVVAFDRSFFYDEIMF